MTEEQTKLADARAILDEMRREEVQTDRDSFRRHASAFLNTSRSVMQYIFEKAKAQGRLVTWYNPLAQASIWCGRFKDLRDADIHERPFSPTARHFLEIRETVGISDTITVTQKFRIAAEGESAGMSVDEDGNPLPVVKLGDKGVFCLDLSGGCENGVSQRTEFVIDVGGEDKPLFDCCEAYLDELASNIEKAQTEGIIET